MKTTLNNPARILHLLLRLVAAVILLQTLYFKFTGAPESVYIFTTVGMEPWGRYGSGVGELIAAALLLMPYTAWIGAGMGVGVMAGALFFHLTKLGIVVKDDGGTLFYLALAVMICCLFILFIDRNDAVTKVKSLLPKKA